MTDYSHKQALFDDLSIKISAVIAWMSRPAYLAAESAFWRHTTSCRQRSSASSVNPVANISHPVSAIAAEVAAVSWKFPTNLDELIFICVTLRSKSPVMADEAVEAVVEFILLEVTWPKFRWSRAPAHDSASSVKISLTSNPHKIAPSAPASATVQAVFKMWLLTQFASRKLEDTRFDTALSEEYASSCAMYDT
jgi:hypothetical protein